MKGLLYIGDAAVKIVIASVIIYCVLLFFSSLYTPKSNVELYYPHDEYGARIPGTNYIIEGRDTLEIVKSYRYRILDQKERAQAREYIKSLRK